MQHLILDTNGLTIKKKNKCFLIVSKFNKSRLISPLRVKSIIVISEINLSTAAVRLAITHDIPIYYGDQNGTLHGTIRSKFYKNNTKVRSQQLLWSISGESIEWINGVLKGKFENQYFYLSKYRSKNDLSEYFTDNFSFCTDINALRVEEAKVAKRYWSMYRTLLPVDIGMKARQLRPAEDIVNCLINYFYGFLYTLVEQAIWANGLNPYVAIMHQNAYNSPVLVFDMIEPFRPTVDFFIIKILEEKLINTELYNNAGKIRITTKDKRVLIPLFLDHLKKVIVIDSYKTSIQKHIYRNAYLLKKKIESFEIDYEKIRSVI